MHIYSYFNLKLFPNIYQQHPFQREALGEKTRENGEKLIRDELIPGRESNWREDF